MLRRRRRARRRRSPPTLAPVVTGGGGDGYLVGMALEARLLGLRILTLRAVVDVAEGSRPGPAAHAVPARAVELRGGDASVLERRRNAEALLVAAQESLGASRSAW